ncbi:DUF6270 domain-containing protein [Aeromonas veronii]|uniref:DUF6270 domain-containing protein n=1 Tax=Aeromonas veronii TaxID=654 RepID=UPI0039F6657F
MKHALISHSSLDDVFFSVTAINSIVDKNNHLFEPYIFIYDAQEIPEEIESLLDFYSIKYISIQTLREFVNRSLQKKVQAFFSNPYKVSSLLPLYLDAKGYKYSLNIDKSVFCFSVYNDQILPSDGSLTSSRFKNVDIGTITFNRVSSLKYFYHDGMYKVIDNSFYYIDNERFKVSDTISKYMDFYRLLENEISGEELLHNFALSSALISTSDLTEIDKSYYHSANNCTFVNPQLRPNIKNIIYTRDNYPWDNLNRGAIKGKVGDRNGIVFFYRSTWLDFAAKNPWFSSFCSQKVLTSDDQVGIANIVCYWYNQKIIELESKVKSLSSELEKSRINSQIELSIIGSCVSRDNFNSKFNPNYKNHFKFKHLQHQSSLVSLMSPKVEISSDDISDVDDWSRQQIVRDFQKSILAEIESDSPSVILFDLFTDSRFPCIEVDNSYVTLNEWKLVNTNLYKKISNNKIIGFTENESEFLKHFTDSVKALKAKLNEVSPLSKIVLNSTRGALKYISQGEVIDFKVNYVKEINRRWELLEKIFIDIMDPVVINAFKQDVTLGDALHPWGLGYVHYTREFYNDFLKHLIDSLQDLDGKG